jgi:hypothetical protein
MTRANNVTVGVLLSLGLICGGKSLTGTQIDLVEYCFKPYNSSRFCTPDKRYTAPLAELPPKATRLRVIPASNPNKPSWGLAAFVLCCGAYALSKGREQRLVVLVPQEREQIKTSWLITKLRSALRLQKEAFTANLDYEFHQWSETRRVRSAQLNSLSPQELMVYQQQVRAMAEAEVERQNQQLLGSGTPALPGQSLDDVIRGDNKISAGDTPALPPSWFKDAVSYHCVLVWGGQDGGKTTAASQIVKARKDRGDRILVFDPHAAKGQWEGLEVIGAGMDYDAIDQAMAWYFAECERRYKLLRSDGVETVEKLGRICLVVEELTNYADRCQNSGEFIRACLSDNRKIFMNVLCIAHGRTLSTLGGAKGVAKTRDDSFFELHCIPPLGETPRRWEVKYPAGEFYPVEVPKWETIKNFSSQAERLPIDRTVLERHWELEFNLLPPQAEPVNRPQDKDLAIDEQRFTPFNLTRQQVIELIQSLQLNLNQTQIIERLWRCKKGSSAAWKQAHLEFKDLIRERNADIS